VEDYGAAEAALRPVVARLRERVPRQRLTALSELRLADALNKQKRYEEAVAFGYEGYKRLGLTMGYPSVEMTEGRAVLTETYNALGQTDKARELSANR
jgi:hypothetical protein